MRKKAPSLDQVLGCIKCYGNLAFLKTKIICKKCKKEYSIINGIPNFLPKMDKNKEYQIEIWDDKTYRVDPETHVFTTIQEHFGNKMLQNIPIPKGGVVVDIGCFIGEKLWQLKANKDYLGIGVDIAIESLVAAAEIDKYGHKYVAADLEQLPFKDNSVDCVLIFDVIEHLSNQEKGYKEVARILKPGGTFLLHIPIRDNKYSMFWMKQKLFPESAMKDYLDVGHAPERMMSSAEIKKYLEKYHMKKKWEIFYNSFFIHFFDRELMKVIGFFVTRVMGKKTIREDEQVREVHQGGLGTVRKVYGKFVVPTFRVLSFADFFLSKFKIGNTYFVYSEKENDK